MSATSVVCGDSVTCISLHVRDVVFPESIHVCLVSLMLSSCYKGEVEVEPMIEEEAKLVWEPPAFESLEKELEELRQTLHGKVRTEGK